MARVDPRDDSQKRWILRWYRYDPQRHERRHTEVAAYTRKREFFRAMKEASAQLEVLQAEGKAESVEYVSGIEVPAGQEAEIRRLRETGVLRKSNRGRPSQPSR